MKNPIIIYSLSFLLCFFCSCENKRSITDNDYFIVNASIQNVEKLNYNELFTSYRAIPLETNDESLIKLIEKIYVTENDIIIFDSNQSAILIFSKQGDFVRRIGKKGSGPNEYIHFNDIFFDSKTQMIYAHERHQNRIFTYDLLGNFINKTQVSNYLFNSFCLSEDGIWAYSCFIQKNKKDGYNLMLLDNTIQKQKGVFFPQKEFVNASYSSTFTLDEKGTPYFFFPSSNIIYQLNNNAPKPLFKIDFGSKTMPYDRIIKLTDYKVYENLVSNKAFLGGIRNFLINQRVCCFMFSESGFNIPVDSYTCFITLSDTHYKIYSASSIQSFDFPIWNQPIGISENSIIYVLYPFFYPEENKAALEKIISKQVDSEMNPILFFMDLKT